MSNASARGAQPSQRRPTREAPPRRRTRPIGFCISAGGWHRRGPEASHLQLRGRGLAWGHHPQPNGPSKEPKSRNATTT